MKQKFKLATAALSMFLLIGCGTDSESETDTGSNNGSEVEDSGEEAAGLPEMTDEEITLDFINWLNPEVYEAIADEFMEEYPNITVNVLSAGQENYDDFLLNLASTGDLPDVYWYAGNVDVPIRNRWLADFTEYWENDPDNENLLETLVNIGYVDGERKMVAPSGHFPFGIFLNEAIFEEQNVEMPSPDWTYSEMIALIEQMTIPEEGIYGLYQLTDLATMAPIVNADAMGEFGWDGQSFDLTTEWADAQQQRAEFLRNGNHAPWPGTDEAEAAFGDREAWPPDTGQVAILFDMIGAINHYEQEAIQELGLRFVPYPVPRGDNAETINKPAFIDFAGMSSGTEHPREAYELMKWMGWGREGTLVRMAKFREFQEENPHAQPDGAPLLQDQDLWDEFRALLPEGQYYDDYLERLTHPIPMAGNVIPGFGTWYAEVYDGGEYGHIPEAIANGQLNPHDVSGDLTNRLNEIYQETMQELFE